MRLRAPTRSRSSVKAVSSAMWHDATPTTTGIFWSEPKRRRRHCPRPRGWRSTAIRSDRCARLWIGPSRRPARASDHQVSLANALVQSACPVALLVGDLTLAECYVKALMDLSARHTLELWNLAGRCFEGVLLIK